MSLPFTNDTLPFLDIDVLIPGNGNSSTTTLPFAVQASATDIQPGKAVKITGNYAVLIADAHPLIGTDVVIGVTASQSTQTASLDGTIQVLMPIPGVIYKAKAKDTTLISTQAELTALLNKQVVFDVTNGIFTIDTAVSEISTNGLRIVGGDITLGLIYFIFLQSGTVFN